nr:hypothetical protein [uncultured Mediterranean phage uvMED]BAR25741.1 hypothetical protein [uncultured Mediterranean phage uvMED]
MLSPEELEKIYQSSLLPIDIPKIEEEEEEDEEEQLISDQLATTPTSTELTTSLADDVLANIYNETENDDIFRGPSFPKSTVPMASPLTGEEKAEENLGQIAEDTKGLLNTIYGVMATGFVQAKDNLKNIYRNFQLEKINEAELTIKGEKEVDYFPYQPSIIDGRMSFSDVYMMQDRNNELWADAYAKKTTEEKAEFVNNIEIEKDKVEAAIAAGAAEVDRVAKSHGLGERGRAAASGIASASLMVPAMITSLATRNPTFAMSMVPVFGALERGSSYTEAVQGGLSHQEAKDLARVNMFFEIGTEAISAPFQVKAFKTAFDAFKVKNRTKAKDFAVNGLVQLAAEQGTEQINTLLQETNKAVRGLKNELNVAWNLRNDPTYNGPSWQEVLRKNAEMTAIATLVGSGTIVGTQGAITFTPEVKSFLNSLDPSEARRFARELETVSREVESNYHAVDKTFIGLSEFAKRENILGRNSGIYTGEQPIDLDNPDIEKILNPSRQSFEVGPPEFFVDEEMVKNIISSDSVVQLSDLELQMASLYLEQVSTEETNLEDFLLAAKQVSNIFDFSSLQDTDSIINRAKAEAKNIYNKYKTAKAENKKSLRKDLKTINSFLQYFNEGKQTPNTFSSKFVFPEDFEGRFDFTEEGAAREVFGFGIGEFDFKNLEDIKGTFLGGDLQATQADVDRIKDEYTLPFLLSAYDKKNEFLTIAFLNQSINEGDLANLYDLSDSEISDALAMSNQLKGFGYVLPPEFKAKDEFPLLRGFSRGKKGSYRDPLEVEDDMLARVLDISFKLGLPENMIKPINAVLLENQNFNNSGRVGTYNPSNHTITLSEKYFTEDFQEEKGSIQLFNAASTFIHEIAHSIDFTFNQIKVKDNDDLELAPDIKHLSIASSSPLFDLPDFGKEVKVFEKSKESLENFNFETGGEVFNELFNIYKKSLAKVADITLEGKADVTIAERDDPAAVPEIEAEAAMATKDAEDIALMEGNFFKYPFDSLFTEIHKAMTISVYLDKIKDNNIVKTKSFVDFFNKYNEYYKNFGMTTFDESYLDYKSSQKEFIKSELFAQAFSLKYTNQEFLRENAPRTFKLIEDIENAYTSTDFKQISRGLRDAFGYDSSQPDFKVYSIPESYLPARTSIEQVRESLRMGDNDTGDGTDRTTPDSPREADGRERLSKPQSDEGTSRDADPNRSIRNITEPKYKKTRDSEDIIPSGHANDYVPPNYGPPAHDLNAFSEEEFTPSGFSTFSFNAGPNYENLKYMIGEMGEYQQEERALINTLLEIRGNPDALITVYRAAPTGELREGDLITPIRAEALFYIEESKITQAEVAEAMKKERIRRREEEGADELAARRAEDIFEKLDGILGATRDETPSELFVYQLPANEVRFDGNGGLSRWGYFPSKVIDLGPRQPTKEERFRNKIKETDIDTQFFTKAEILDMEYHTNRLKLRAEERRKKDLREAMKSSDELQRMDRQLEIEGKSAGQKNDLKILLRQEPDTFQNFPIGAVIDEANPYGSRYQVINYGVFYPESIDPDSVLRGKLVVRVLEDRGINKLFKAGDIDNLDVIELQEQIIKDPKSITIFKGPQQITEKKVLPPEDTQEDKEFADALDEAIKDGTVVPPKSPPPPPRGPDPKKEFTPPQLSRFQELLEGFNIFIANRFGRQWTVEESLLQNFGEHEIVKRLQEVGIDPDSKDWRVTTQTDIYQGKVKDQLRDFQERFYIPMLKFLTAQGINAENYNDFVYSLHAPERNKYLPTLYTEKVKEAEAEVAEVSFNPESTTAEKAAAKRKLTVAQNLLEAAKSGSGITTEQAEKTLKKYGVELENNIAKAKDKTGEAYLQAYERFHKPMIEFMRKTYKDSGLVMEDKIEDWQERYNYYVPLKGFALDTFLDPKSGREVERPSSGNKFIDSSMTVSGTIVQKAKGRKSLADAPLEQTIKDGIAALIQAEKNDVIKTLANLSRAFPNDKYWLVVEDAGQLKKQDAAWDPTKGKSRIGFREDGVQKYIELYDRRLAAGFENMDNAITSEFVKAFRIGTRYLSMINTSLDPAFMINNFIRDIQAAAGNLFAEEQMENGRAYGKPIIKKYFTTRNILKNAGLLIKFENTKSIHGGLLTGMEGRKQFRDTLGSMAREGKEINVEEVVQLGKESGMSEEEISKQAKLFMFKKFGGETGYIDQKTVDQLKDEFRKLRDLYSGKLKSLPRKGAREALGLIERFNSGVENAARFTAFEGYIELSGGVENATNADFEKAASLAKNLTINFNRMGTMGPTINAFYMFFNASVQGTVNVFRGLNPLSPYRSSRKAKAVGGLTTIGSLATLWNILYSAEDDTGRSWYEQIPDWEKQTKFIFMLPDIDAEGGNIEVRPWGSGSEYYRISQDGKRKLPIGIGIPKPYGYALFHDVGRITTEYALAKSLDTYEKSLLEAGADLGESILHNYAPLTFADLDATSSAFQAAVPSTVKPFSALQFNRDHFGSPIYQSEERRKIIQDTSPRSYNNSKRSFEFVKGITKTINNFTGGNQFIAGKLDFDPNAFQFLMDEATGGIGRTTRRIYNLATDETLAPTDIVGLRRILAGPKDYVLNDAFEDAMQETLAYKNAINDFERTDIPPKDLDERQRDFEKRQPYDLSELVLTGSKKSVELMRSKGGTSLFDLTNKSLREAYKELRELKIEIEQTESVERKLRRERDAAKIQLKITTIKKEFLEEYNRVVDRGN